MLAYCVPTVVNLSPCKQGYRLIQHRVDQLVIVHSHVIAWGLREACQNDSDHCCGGHTHGEQSEFIAHGRFIEDVLAASEGMLTELDLIRYLTDSCQFPQRIFPNLKIKFALVFLFSYK